MPEEAEPQAWHDLIWRAWEDLRFDRQYLPMGGEMPVPFTAIDAYARRYNISGRDFDEFKALLKAVDDEWLSFVAERAKEERAKAEAAAKRR